MSSFPPPQPMPQEYSLTPRAKVWPAVVSWIVILLCVGFIVLAQYIPEIRGRKRAAPGGAIQEAQLEMVARYAVGFHQLFKGLTPQATTAATSPTTQRHADPTAQMAQMVDKEAKGPLDEFH